MNHAWFSIIVFLFAESTAIHLSCTKGFAESTRGLCCTHVPCIPLIEPCTTTASGVHSTTVIRPNTASQVRDVPVGVARCSRSSYQPRGSLLETNHAPLQFPSAGITFDSGQDIPCALMVAVHLKQPENFWHDCWRRRMAKYERQLRYDCVNETTRKCAQLCVCVFCFSNVAQQLALDRLLNADTVRHINDLDTTVPSIRVFWSLAAVSMTIV